MRKYLHESHDFLKEHFKENCIELKIFQLQWTKNNLIKNNEMEKKLIISKKNV